MDNAVVLAENVFGSTYGKTANGLVRYSKRYNITSVIDSRYAGDDAGRVLSGKPKGIPIVGSVQEGKALGSKVFIVGIATDGGYIPEEYRKYIREAINEGMTVVSGLHEFISDDPEFSALSRSKGTNIIDVRKMFRDMKMPFTGSIREVKATKIAVLGTDSAIGKRTTSVFLNQAMNQAGKKSVMIGTGQTSWMQGFPYTVVVDSMINDFIPGNLEWVTHEAWVNEKPDYMFLEGQGSVLHPAYPGSFEIIGACRPDAIILQHAPKRKAFDGFEEFPIPPLEKYINILENLSNRKVIAISINSENMDNSEIKESISCLQGKFGIPVFNPLEPLDSVAREIESLSV